MIRKGLGYALLLVLAGPGYGKTLSVCHYLKNADIRLIYVRMSNLRTNAADFWDDTIKAAKRELPEYAGKLTALGFPDSAASFEQFYEFTSETAEAGTRLVYVVDNYERILDDSIIRFLNNLVDSNLPNFTMIILCNTMLPFAEVLPAAGQLRITDENLAFTVDEARLMFEQYGANASPDILERAVKVTGGWPLGLRLICESRPENPEEFSSRSPLQVIADLHEQHYFRNYSKDVQNQLVLFSLLPQFSLEMIQIKMDTPRDVFAHTLMQHPFVSYDYGNGLFIFQAMYHSFLRQRQSMLSLDARKETGSVAGQWFLAHDMTDEAMDCFWDAGDYDGFMDAVYAMPKVRTYISLTNRVLQRLEQIPRSYAASNHGVDYARAFMYLNAADALQAKKLFLEVEKRLQKTPSSDSKRLMLGDIYAALADIAIYRGEDTGLAWMKKAFEQVPNGTRIHSPELLALGGNSAFFLPNSDAGQLAHMVEYFFEYAEYADKVKNGCGNGYEYLFAGEAAYYTEDMDRAAKMFNSALIKAQHTGQHDIICNALWNLGRIEVYYGNQKNAFARLHEIETYVNENRLVGLYELRDSFVFWFHWKIGDVGEIPSWFADTMSAQETSPISMAKKQLLGAYYLYLNGEISKSYALLLQLEPMLESQGRWTERFCLYILKAQHHMISSEPEQFEKTFRKAYGMVYANNMKLCMSGFGKEMTVILDYLKKQEPSAYDITWLDDVYRDSISIAKRLQVMQSAYKGRNYGGSSSVSLTKRENETLHFLAQGLTQKEIGRLMGISENAVKKHISKIYLKLGAVNRADAIHIATVNGLVDVLNR